MLSPAHREQMNELCLKIQVEKDARKLTELAEELDSLLARNDETKATIQQPKSQPH